MPLCGFNQEMLEGMNEFHQGLAEESSVEEVSGSENSETQSETR
ncbi:MAG: hypothetical protein WDZ69_00120 [Candidatus Pacearchaeota archaeon]